MVKHPEVQLDGIFHALADPTRRAMLRRLAESDATIMELAGPFDMSLPAVSKHLRVMEDAALVEREREGRSWRCRLLPDPLHDALVWLQFYQRFWQGQLSSVGDYLREMQEQPASPHASKKKSTQRSKSGERK